MSRYAISAMAPPSMSGMNSNNKRKERVMTCHIFLDKNQYPSTSRLTIYAPRRDVNTWNSRCHTKVFSKRRYESKIRIHNDGGGTRYEGFSIRGNRWATVLESFIMLESTTGRSMIFAGGQCSKHPGLGRTG